MADVDGSVIGALSPSGGDSALEFIAVDGAVVSSLLPASGDGAFEYIAVNGSAVNLGPEPLPPPPAPDTTLPEIANFLPPAGTGIANDQAIQFDVTDESGVAAVVLLASFPDGSVEVVHDNIGFRGKYIGGVNTRASIANGYRFTVRRLGGWIASPTFEVLSVDTSGNIGAVA